MANRAKIAAAVFSATATTRNLADEPLTADDWAKVWQAKKNFTAALRQIVFDARCREAELRKTEELADARSY